MDLLTSGGQRLYVGSGVAARLSSGPAGSIPLIGSNRSYAATPWSLWTGMFGVFIPNNDQMSFTVDTAVFPTAFPSGTVFAWNVIPDGRYGGVNGYLHIDYGNYDDSACSITPRQLKNITALSMSFDWAFSGSNLSGLLCECWPSTTSHATGPVANADAVAEVGFFPKCSPGSQAFAAGLTPVGTGSFTDANGVVWNVGQGVSGVGGLPYYVATRVSYVDHHGPLDFKSYFAFLRTSGKFTGNEWFNGAAFGVEPLSGASTLTINTQPTVSYS